MDRHAYMIMAHGQFDQLFRLMKLLDDKRNDLFIHIDAKAGNFDSSILGKTDWIGRVFFSDRADVHWGSISIVQAVFNLLRKAADTGTYRYYHLLSGADMPLKTQDEIHAFLSGCDKEFIHFWPDNREERVKYYHIFEDDFKNGSVFKRRIRGRLNAFQKMIHIDRCRKDSFKIMHGSAWFSITDDFARHVIKKENMVMRRWRWTLFPDESFMQTIAFNSRFRNKLFVPLEKQADDDHAACMRKIDWSKGNPYVWRDKDFNELMDSGCMFGRKFDPDADLQIILRIEKALTG